MSSDDIVSACETAVLKNCAEAFITLGEVPEDRYEIAASWLLKNGYGTTIDYLTYASRIVLTQLSLLPHINSGAVSDKSLRRLKEVSVSQSMMLETIAGRLSEPGGPHFGSPDKTPARRLATLEAAGRVQIPFSTGILVGIGETRLERIEALLALRDLNQLYGHIQEVVIQRFMPQSGTVMAFSPPADEEEYLWSIAAARLIFETTTHIQASSTSFSLLPKLVSAGIDDLGSLSPSGTTPGILQYQWPNLEAFSIQLEESDRSLRARTPIYPEFITKDNFVDTQVLPYLMEKIDSAGYLVNDPLESTGMRKDPESKVFLQAQTHVAPHHASSHPKERATKQRSSDRPSNFPTSRTGK